MNLLTAKAMMTRVTRGRGDGVIERIQYRRGQKLPRGAKLVARPSRWGNPFRVDVYGRLVAIGMYRQMLEDMSTAQIQQYLAPLQDATALACYCPLDEPCHADVLIEYLEQAK